MNNNSYLKLINHNKLGFSLYEVDEKSRKTPNFKQLQTNELFWEIVGEDFNLTNHPEIYNNCIKLLSEAQDGEFDLMLTNNFGYKANFTYLSDNSFILSIDQNQKINNKDQSIYYEQIINSMNDLVWIMDTDFNFTYMSPSIKNVLGYDVDDLVGKNITEVMSEENINKAKALYDVAIINQNRESWLIDINQMHKAGHMVMMEYIVRFLKDANDNITSMMGVGRDITEWMVAEQKLRESKERLTLLLNSTAEGIFGVDQNGIITFVNKACLDVLGYDDIFDLVNKHVKVIMGIDNDEEFFLERFKKVFAGITHQHEVDQFVRKDGSSFVAEYYIYPQTINSKIVGCVITFFDITEKIKIENELYEAERSKSVLIANIPGLVYRCSYDEHYTMSFVSDGSYDLTGYFPDQLIGNRDISFNDIIVPKYRKRIRDRLDAIIGKDEIFKEEYEIICADGSTKWVLEQAQFIYDDNGEVLALEGMLIDISDQKKKQAEIEYLSQYDSLTGLRNRFSYDRAKDKYLSEEYLPVSMIVGDINGLKLINDAFGHNEGDRMIIETARLLSEVMGSRDLVYRTSGDEFTIFLPNTDSKAAYEKLKEIMDHVNEYNLTIYNDLFRINLALGFATLENLDADFKDVARVAEEYMYKRKLNDRKSSYSTIISYIKSTMYERSQVTEEHAERLKEYSNMLGLALNLSQVELDELALVSTLHDIGKVGIDDRILKKPEPLTDEEWAEMKRHPEIGYRICMASPELMSIAPYVLSHHERWDGTGYPAGLKGEEIPLLARIISIVDAYDAMTEDRVYRKKLSKEEALAEIEKNAGTQFDPKLAKLFAKLMRNEKNLRNKK